VRVELQYSLQSLRQVGWVYGPGQKAVVVILNHLRDSAHRECDHGKTRRERFQQNARHSFLFRWDDQNVEVAHDRAHVFLPVQKLDGQARGEAQDVVIISAFAKQGRAANDESNMRRVRHESRRGMKKLRLPLFRCDATDDADTQFPLFKIPFGEAKIGGSVGDRVDLGSPFPERLGDGVAAGSHGCTRPAQCKSLQ